jgi:acyl-CoA synthetase (AMP-forming)/AMP-acid ligase II
VSIEDHAATNLGYWAVQAAERYPDRIAIVDWVGDVERQITHGALEQRLTRAAAMWAATGLEPGARVAIGIGNRREFVEAMFGALRAGLVAVPLNLRQGIKHLQHVVADAGCTAAIVEPDANPHLMDILSGQIIRCRIALAPAPAGWTDYEEAMAAAGERFTPVPLEPGAVALMAYTSGSTGLPKGVVLTHESQAWWIARALELYPVDPEERSLVAVPLYHKNAMAGVVKIKLPGGASMVLLPSFEPRRFLETLSAFHCTHATGVPTVFSLALRERDLIGSLDFSALRSLSVGSAPVHDDLHLAMDRGFKCRVLQSYGLTEGGPVVIGTPADGTPVPLGSCGKAWPGTEAKLVDAEGRENARRGELWLRNPGLTAGYQKLPDVTRQRLRDGWLATGDLFERDEAGFFYFRGRTDDMFDCGGENIFPKEVEELLLSHPGVREACVVPVAHATKGHVPAAMVVLDPAQAPTAAALKQFTIETGAAYAHPRLIVVVDALPLNGAGKVDRNTVRACLADAAASAGHEFQTAAAGETNG